MGAAGCRRLGTGLNCYTLTIAFGVLCWKTGRDHLSQSIFVRFGWINPKDLGLSYAPIFFSFSARVTFHDSIFALAL